MGVCHQTGGLIRVGRELAAANGFADRIEFIQTLSTQVTLPERADVIVSDLHGVLPLLQPLDRIDGEDPEKL